MKNTYLFQFFAHVNITSPDWLPVVFDDRLPSCAHGVTPSLDVRITKTTGTSPLVGSQRGA